MWTKCEICGERTRWRLGRRQEGKFLRREGKILRTGLGDNETRLVHQFCDDCLRRSSELDKKISERRHLADEAGRRRRAENVPEWLAQAPPFDPEGANWKRYPLARNAPPMYRHDPDWKVESYQFNELVAMLSTMCMKDERSMEFPFSLDVGDQPGNNLPAHHYHVLNRKEFDRLYPRDGVTWVGSLFTAEDGSIRVVWEWAYRMTS